MKKFVLCVFMGLSAAVYAGGLATVDNEKIQDYMGHTGRWVVSSSSRGLAYYIRTFGSSYTDIIDINGRNYRKERTVFLPYSKKYLEYLESKGISRDKIDCPEDYIWPVQNFDRITSAFGKRWRGFHEGIDIPAGRGIPIVAAKSGRVTVSKFMEGYGKTVWIEHRGNISTRYSHASELLVKEGDLVHKGQVVALVGSTGNSTGAHLHFEVRCGGIPLNPLHFLPFSSNVKQTQYMKRVE